MSNQTVNSTIVMMSDAERFSWVAWLVFVFLSSFGGSITILVASVKYRAFRLNQVIVTIIEHIAVCDILIALIGVLTQIVTMVTKRWLFGTAACYIKAYTGHYINVVSIFFITTMTAIKFILVKFPLKTRSWSRKQGHVICATVWIFCLILPVSFVLIDREDVIYNQKIYTCSYTLSSKKWKFLNHLFLAIFSVIPMVTTVIITVFLFKHLLNARKVAKRSGSKLRWQGLVTVVLTAGIFCMSYLPHSVLLPVRPFLKNKPVVLYKVVCAASAVLRLNVMSNAFVYCFTVKSFRAFLSGRVEHFTSVMSHQEQVSTQEGEFCVFLIVGTFDL